jgi:protein-disulfide isomerase
MTKLQEKEIAVERSAFLTTPMATVIGAVIISIAILINGGIIQIKGVSGGSAKAGQLAQASSAPTQAIAPQPTEDTSPKQISVDDDPVLGDKNAPVTLIEFSDYECPFCKRHFDQVYGQIKKDYIDTGKVKLVYRDFPLSFHDPMATTEAIAANCAREQGGDTAYFKLHDEMFKQTTSNGNGLSKDKIYTMATELGLSTDNLKSCVEAEKYKDEVTKDIADGSAGGVSGTPGFFIGKSSADGKITGTPLVGAQPYAAFKTIIDQQLK